MNEKTIEIEILFVILIYFRHIVVRDAMRGSLQMWKNDSLRMRMLMKFFRFVFVGMEMRMAEGLRYYFWSLRCHTGDKMLMCMFMRVLNPD